MTTTEPTTEPTTPTETAVTETDEITRIVDVHLAAYCEPDAATRAALVAAAWATDGRLMDPPFEGTGHAAIAALADTVLAHFPAHTFRRTTAVEHHHGVGRYGWELVSAAGEVSVAGIDIVDFAPDGTLQRVVGFFG